MDTERTLSMERIILYVFVLLLAAIFAGGFVASKSEHECTMPTMMEMQDYLQSEGYYNGEIDGIIGRETLAAWVKWEADRYSVINMEAAKRGYYEE